jgi:lipopolysaccharide export system ATP-binding protein
MSLGSQRDFGVDSTAVDANREMGLMGRLRGLFGGKRPAAEPRANHAEAWLLESGQGSEAQEALGSEWLPQDLETWQTDGAESLAPPAALKPAAAASRAAAPVPVSTAGQQATAALPSGSLIVQGLSKAYKKRQIIKDVSLMVHRGEAVGLLGPNGAGKTTLFYMITGLIRPDSGMIMIDDYDVTALPMYRRARLGIGYLPQEPSIFRGLSVEENIRAVLEITQPDKTKRAEELEALLEEFDIARLRKLPAIALSGGERRRCEIARSLAGHPLFMLLDEPFAGIDPIAIGDIRQLVQHLKRRGIGVLITDHNVRETLDLIDRAYIVHGGGVLTEGAPDEIVANPDVRRFYLGESFRL